MANDKHLIESVTNKQGQIITVNLLVDDENWFEILEDVERNNLTTILFML